MDNNKKKRREIRKSRRGNGVSSFPFVLITLGVIFALDTFKVIDGAFWKLWPLLLIVIGLVKLGNYLFVK